jgi:hypothetical protein
VNIPVRQVDDLGVRVAPPMRYIGSKPLNSRVNACQSG